MSSVEENSKLEKLYKSSTTLDFTIVPEDEPINTGTKGAYYKLTYGKPDKCIKRKELLYNKEFLKRYPQYLDYLCKNCSSSSSFCESSSSSSCHDCGCSDSNCSCPTCSDDSHCPANPHNKNRKEKSKGKELATFVQITDVHIIDPCDPSRVSFLAPFLSYDPAIADAFRPYEAFSTQVAECMVRKINHLECGPHLKQKISMVINTGDNADSMSNNELTNFINILNGGPVIPNAASKDYIGVQDNMPSEAYPFYYHPDPPPPSEGPDVYKVDYGYPDYPNILNEAMKPFIATGLKIPWYSCNGNHDVTKLGNYSLGYWKMRELFNSVSTGTIPGLGSKLIEGMTVFQAMEFAKALTFQDADGTLKIIQESLLRDVPRSSKRYEFTKASFISMHCNNVFCSRCDPCGATRRESSCDASRRELSCSSKENDKSNASGLSCVRDCAEKNRCDGKEIGKESEFCHGYTRRNIDLNVLYYTFKISDKVTGIMLDSCNPNGNLENQDLAPNGSLGSIQISYLEQELNKRHSTYYNNQGELVRTNNKDELIMIFCHHTIETMNNTFTSPTTFDNDPERVDGKVFTSILWRYPNITALVCGHTHKHDIKFYPNPTGKSQGFVMINTASHIDWPQQSRIIEVGENCNGTISIYTTVINHLSPANSKRAIFPNKCCSSRSSCSNNSTESSNCCDKSENSEKIYCDKYSTTEIASISRELSYNDVFIVNKFDDGENRSGTPLDRNVEIIMYNPLLRNNCCKEKTKCKK